VVICFLFLISAAQRGAGALQEALGGREAATYEVGDFGDR
jgi:hypothetical protein